MQRDDYDAQELMKDATDFALSKFGQHYLGRLEAAKARHLVNVQDVSLSETQTVRQAAMLATVQAELDYFETAKKVQSDPNLLKRLADKAKRRNNQQPTV